MTRKPYDETLAKWAACAESTIRRYLMALGYEVIHLPNGKFAHDCECRSDNEHFFVEVERRTARTWRDGEFPYATATIPERRKPSKDTMLFIVRYDLKAAMVVFSQDLAESELVERANRYVAEGEMFRSVNLCRCLAVDMTIQEPSTIAAMNRASFYQKWNTPHHGMEMKVKLLGTSPPYGMSFEEWSELQVSAYEHLEDDINARLAPIQNSELKTQRRWW